MARSPKGYIPCPCCGYYAIVETFDICPICSWEHDPVQAEQPDCNDGANKISLREAQRNFQAFGAMDQESVRDSRPPTSEDIRDPEWRPLTEIGKL